MKTKIVLLVLILASGLTSFAQKKQTLKGNYRTVMGVQNPLSCYAFNAGYLTTEQEEEIAVSFDKLEIDKVRNGKIEVTGFFEEITRESGENDPCPSGTRTVFIVQQFKRLKNAVKR